ncbi:MAG: hypothetical protein ACLPTM_02710 [Steroidobacteraceae bacterium]
MRPEWRFTVAAIGALAVGAVCAEPYARLAAPYYAAVDRLIAMAHPWTIERVAVTTDPKSPGVVLRLIGEVRRQRSDLKPEAIAVSRVQVGTVIETPIVFWTLLLAWPAASARQRWIRLAVGVAVFLGLEAVTTATLLLYPVADVSSRLTHDEADPLSLWGRWTRFLEAGGTFAVAAAAALVTVAVSSSVSSRSRAN